MDDKPFKEMTRNDILSFLDSKRKSKIVDPMHKWITTYSHHLINLLYILEPGKGFEFSPRSSSMVTLMASVIIALRDEAVMLMKRHLIAPDPARIYIGFLYGTQEEI